MKRTTNLKWRLILAFVISSFGFAQLNVYAQPSNQMFQQYAKINIGAKVKAVEFIKSSSNALVAIGTQNESDGSLQIRYARTGEVLKTINTYGAVFALASSADIPYIAVGTIYGANVYGLQNNKRIILQTPGRGVITDILWLDGTGNSKDQVVTGDQDGNICFFKLDTNTNYLLPYKTIPYPVNPAEPSMKYANPAVFSVNFWNNKLSAGYLNQVVSWDTTGWVRNFQTYEPRVTNSGRALFVQDISNFLLTADRDSIQAYNFNGTQKYRVPFYSGDSPVDIALGIKDFTFVGIGTTWDKCLVYKVDSTTATFIGNFSNHTHSVHSVDFRNFESIGLGYLMATGSSDQTVEIWRYNTSYRP